MRLLFEDGIYSRAVFLKEVWYFWHIVRPYPAISGPKDETLKRYCPIIFFYSSKISQRLIHLVLSFSEQRLKTHIGSENLKIFHKLLDFYQNRAKIYQLTFPLFASCCNVN